MNRLAAATCIWIVRGPHADSVVPSTRVRLVSHASNCARVQVQLPRRHALPDLAEQPLVEADGLLAARETEVREEPLERLLRVRRHVRARGLAAFL
jgi:hypothetical protein